MQLWRDRKRGRIRQSETREPADLAAGSDREPDAVTEWLAFWDADSEHVDVTGEHLSSVMWSDDGAVGLRGWYY